MSEISKHNTAHFGTVKKISGCNGTAIPLVIAAVVGLTFVNPLERWAAISSSREQPVIAA